MNFVWFHASTKIVGFTASDGSLIPSLISGDNYWMPEKDARYLQFQGAGIVRYEPIKDTATFMRASEIGGRKDD